MTRISLDDVSKYYDGGDIVANYEIDLEIDDGEFVVILGPSGCGKTTALRIVAGLEDPSAGDVYFDDERVTDRSPSDRNVAMVFQNYALYPHMTVKGNIEYPLKVRGVDPGERDRRIEEVTELLHISDQLGKSPSELSGGQRQRVALARAIVREPTVFLLDEPLSNLDAKLRQEMRSELKRIQDEIGITTVYVTHNQEEAMSMADRVVVMNEGTIRQIAPPEELYSRPRTTWVAQFIGSPPMNLLSGTHRDGVIDFGDAGSVTLGAAGTEATSPADGSDAGPERTVASSETTAADSETTADAGSTAAADAETAAVTDSASGPSAGGVAESELSTGGASEQVSLGVRPEDLSVVTERPTSGNVIEGTVDTVEPMGEFTIVNVRVLGDLVKAKVGSTAVQRGDDVYLTFDDADAYVYDEQGVLVPGQ